MISVRIFAPSWYPGLKATGALELEDGTTLRGALRRAGVSPLLAKLTIVLVNGERAALTQPLEDGDRVSVFPAISGG